MTKLGTITLTGKSEREYEFDMYPIDTNFKSTGVVYYISNRIEKQDGTGRHTAVYIGQTEDASKRFSNHHKESCFKKNNANCISVYQESNENDRLDIETDLTRAYDPPCND